MESALQYLRAHSDDVLVVYKLDRLGRSLKHLIEIVGELEQKGIGFKSLSEGIDTTTAGGKLVFHIFGAIAEFERSLIIERTNVGLNAARARGRKGGRPAIVDDALVNKAQLLVQDKSLPIGDICQTLGISKATYYKRIYPALSADS